MLPKVTQDISGQARGQRQLVVTRHGPDRKAEKKTQEPALKPSALPLRKGARLPAPQPAARPLPSRWVACRNSLPLPGST